MNSGCGRLAKRRLWVSHRLARSSVFQEVVDPTRDELFSRLESFLDLLYTPSGLIFLKKNVCKALCKSYVPIILGYVDSAGPQKGS